MNALETAITDAFDRIVPIPPGGALSISEADLEAMYDGKFGVKPDLGWTPKLCKSLNYYSPDIYYETMVTRLVGEGCSWLDVGCGRNIFPHNRDLAGYLSRRAGLLFGIDPDENINDNDFVTESFQGMVEDCKTDHKFDLVTLRMVAEHIEHPRDSLQSISRMMKPGGLIVIYTPSKWAPMSVLARLTPIRVHHYFKRLLWNTEERDTFPVQYKMNTKKSLRRLFSGMGFREEYFDHLDDCRTFIENRLLLRGEISARNFMNKFGLHYPETCLLGVYRKPAEG